MQLTGTLCSLSVLVLVAGPTAAENPLHRHPAKLHKSLDGHEHGKSYKPYKYAHGISSKYSGVKADVSEKHEGGNTEGAHSYVPPDGRTEQVKHWEETDTGLNADVKSDDMTDHHVPTKKSVKPAKYVPHKKDKHVPRAAQPIYEPVHSYVSHGTYFPPHFRKFGDADQPRNYYHQLFVATPAITPYFDQHSDDDWVPLY